MGVSPGGGGGGMGTGGIDWCISVKQALAYKYDKAFLKFYNQYNEQVIFENYGARLSKRFLRFQHQNQFPFFELIDWS